MTSQQQNNSQGPDGSAAAPDNTEAFDDLLRQWRTLSARAEAEGERRLGEWALRHLPESVSPPTAVAVVFAAIEGGDGCSWLPDEISVVGQDGERLAESDGDAELLPLLEGMSELKPPKHEWHELRIELPSPATADA